MPILDPSFFQDMRMAGAIEAEGLAPWLNLPVFHRPQYLQSHPECYAITSQGRKAVTDWLHFACPSRAETLDHVLNELRSTLTRVRPAVVSLDFIRHFVFWEQVDLTGPADLIEDGCYCPVCLSSFEHHSGEKVDRDDAPTDIRQHLRRPWGAWKSEHIADVADQLLAEVRAFGRDTRLAVNTVPWRESDLDGAIRSSAGQDITRLARGVDIVAPMAFANILHQTPQWKTDLLTYTQELTGKPVLAYVQVDALSNADPITLTQFDNELAATLTQAYAGVAIFHFEQLAANPAKAGILRRHLRPT